MAGDVPGDGQQPDRISELEARVAALSEELGETRRQLTEAQLDQWKGRIDELEVQMHLGRLEAEEQVQPLLEQLRGRWLDAREQLVGAGSTAGDVFGALRSGLEQAMEDMRSGIRQARQEATEED